VRQATENQSRILSALADEIAVKSPGVEEANSGEDDRRFADVHAGIMPSNESEKAFTSPVKLLPTRTRAPAGAFGPNTKSKRSDTATNNNPIIAPVAPEGAFKKSRYLEGTCFSPSQPLVDNFN
jgi:hypothetical protein